MANATNPRTRRAWAPLVSATALLAAMAVLVGCYHPHHYRSHHRAGGYYAYDHDADRSHRGERRHHRRHHRHHAGCRH